MGIDKVINGRRITFELAEDYDDGVAIKATHVDGKVSLCGYIASVTSNGRLERHEDIDEAFGFKLNAKGQIKQVKKETH